MAPDPRFFDTAPPVKLDRLAELAGAHIAGGFASQSIVGAAILQAAGPGQVAFLADRGYVAQAARSGAGACFVTEDLASALPAGCAVLVTRTPQAAWAAVADWLHRPKIHPAGAPALHPTADIEDGAVLSEGVTVGPGAVIGRGTVISPGAVIGPGVAIGRDGYIGPNATIGFALLGDRVRIYAGAVVGEAGFGAVPGPKGVLDIPQLGRVIIQDGVTLGANSCIDRGAFEDTVIGENTKIDNLVQIAHNVVIGRNCVFAAHCGISGSVTIGDGCMFGGRVGVADHLTIGAGARLAAASGVAKNVPSGESWGGTPARPVRQWIRETAWTAAMASRRARRGKEA